MDEKNRPFVVIVIVKNVIETRIKVSTEKLK